MHQKTEEETKKLCMGAALDNPKKVLFSNYFLVKLNSSTAYLKVPIFCCYFRTTRQLLSNV